MATRKCSCGLRGVDLRGGRRKTFGGRVSGGEELTRAQRALLVTHMAAAGLRWKLPSTVRVDSRDYSVWVDPSASAARGGTRHVRESIPVRVVVAAAREWEDR